MGHPKKSTVLFLFYLATTAVVAREITTTSGGDVAEGLITSGVNMAGSGSFDFFWFVQTWPGTFCETMKCSKAILQSM